MKQLSTMSQCPSYQQPRKSFGAKICKMLPAILLLVLFLLTGQGAALAAPNTATMAAHSQSAAMCNWRMYALNPSLRLVNQYGFVVDLQASNLNGQNTVKIWHNGISMGELPLPVSDVYDQIEVSQNSITEVVAACSNWVSE